MKRNTTIDYWPSHLHPVFVAIGAAMAGKRLHPSVLDRLDLGLADRDHRTSVRHEGFEGMKAVHNRYVIEINGPRIAGRWPFQSGELETLARAAFARTMC
jgi:hypothetical protein